MTWMAVGLALTACHCESGPNATPVPMAAQFEPSSPSPNVRTHMAEHFAAAEALQKAIAQGRLSDARDEARWFASHDMEIPTSWQPYVDEMRDAARRIVRSRDVASAGLQLGRFGRACSSCHQAHDAVLAFPDVPPPTDGQTQEAQMRRHQWAAARLWEGLVGPDDRRWEEGARVMATTRFDASRAAHEKPNAEVIELAERLHDQATEAIAVRDSDARAALFGELMETCASCHTIVRPAPVISAK
jgi:cytochrome c556